MTTYSDRPRDFDYMGKVKRLPCAARDMGTPCDGPIEADHAGSRAMSQRADDGTCIPLCRRHHSNRTTFGGAFKTFDQAAMRVWCEKTIAETRIAVERATSADFEIW